MSAFGLARQLGLERSAAQTLHRPLLRPLPGVARYMEEARNTVRELGYVETVFGRRLWLPEIRSSKATAARRPSAPRSTHRCRHGSGLEIKTALQVHDELLLKCRMKS